MRAKEGAAVVDLVLRVFDEFVAPGYAQEGIAEFKKYVTTDATALRLAEGNLFIVAAAGLRIVGVIEIRENHHIALLFVEKTFQGQGIAGNLLRRAIDRCSQRRPDVRQITVNSSPNAFSAYERMGFKAVGDEQTVNGIRFIPMALDLGASKDTPSALTLQPIEDKR